VDVGNQVEAVVHAQDDGDDHPEVVLVDPAVEVSVYVDRPPSILAVVLCFDAGHLIDVISWFPPYWLDWTLDPISEAPFYTHFILNFPYFLS
jgi:hypothetical protein